MEDSCKTISIIKIKKKKSYVFRVGIRADLERFIWRKLSTTIYLGPDNAQGQTRC